jgi:hypothetical protein
VTQYPPPFGKERFSAALQGLQRRITKLESRTSGIDSGFPFAVLPAEIDPDYSGSGSPQVYVNGSSTLSGPYQCLASYTPAAGDTVLIVPVGALQTYFVLGKY